MPVNTACCEEGCTCVTSIVPAGQCFSSAGGTGTIEVDAPEDCEWTAESDNPDVTITSGASGTGPDTVEYSVASGGATTANITICGQVFKITRTETGPCSFTGFVQVTHVSTLTYEEIVTISSNSPDQVCLCDGGFLVVESLSTGTISVGFSHGAPFGVNSVDKVYKNGVLQGCGCVGDGTNQCIPVAAGVTCQTTSGPLLIPVVPGDVITFEFGIGTPGVSTCTLTDTGTPTENLWSTDCPAC